MGIEMGTDRSGSARLEKNPLPLRDPQTVMDIKRLGSMHQSRLSFMRALMRKVMREQWSIQTERMDLDKSGYGSVVYRVSAGENRYSFVAFSHQLADAERSDRVIAEKWDVTLALCMGEVDEARLARLQANVPKQEAGRASTDMLVLSRGNKSSRNFEYVVDELAAGRQPSMQKLAQVGYLYRTTAVYGSGKFGLADWQKVTSQCPEFASPFAAEMFSCFMLRHFSIEQAEHLAKIKSPSTAVPMQDAIKRFIGIGNATGLGMAPYLIRHPQLIAQWVLTRERAIARVLRDGELNQETLAEFLRILAKAVQHLDETMVADRDQTDRNRTAQQELLSLRDWLSNTKTTIATWSMLSNHVTKVASMETQELVNSILLEVFPDIADAQEKYSGVDEGLRLVPEMLLSDLRRLIERHYRWALDIDFSQASANRYFWYRSEEKMEPRLGDRSNEPGVEKEMPLPIARLVRACYDRLCASTDISSSTVAQFVAQHPEQLGIVKRIQGMSQECYGEIRGNLADEHMLPLDLLRCKLSFFGVSKFDPKSKLWVRNTMFQGAPILTDIGKPFNDDWYFPVANPDCTAP
ncbi:MAG: hypothetical protein AAF431_08730 [Pseudomonadota bacterium]